MADVPPRRAIALDRRSLPLSRGDPSRKDDRTGRADKDSSKWGERRRWTPSPSRNFSRERGRPRRSSKSPPGLAYTETYYRSPSRRRFSPPPPNLRFSPFPRNYGRRSRSWSPRRFERRPTPISPIRSPHPRHTNAYSPSPPRHTPERNRCRSRSRELRYRSRTPLRSQDCTSIVGRPLPAERRSCNNLVSQMDKGAPSSVREPRSTPVLKEPKMALSRSTPTSVLPSAQPVTEKDSKLKLLVPEEASPRVSSEGASRDAPSAPLNRILTQESAGQLHSQETNVALSETYAPLPLPLPSSQPEHLPHPNEPDETPESFEQQLLKLADQELIITDLIRDEQAMMARSRTLYDEYITAHQRTHQLIIDHLKAAMEARRALREYEKANTELKHLQQRRQALHRHQELARLGMLVMDP
ncbi:hypothetical protein F5877DRAFT_79250 [Lentinula edodes]|nr:hypothetical protein F5877DRAFT_79250 [Lentinula edodes]